MTQLPRFFYNGTLSGNSSISLDEATAKHIWQVLRMQADDKVAITDGKGTIAETVLHLCVSFTKNNSRNEWLLEKATELGVGTIIPISTKRSEKTYFRHDRWQKILTSAILQSQQYYLPQLSDIMPLKNILKEYKDVPQKLIAHCIDDKNRQPLSKMLKPAAETILLIGPEGDFTQEEVNLCIEHGFQPVSLGAQRLRTETAAITASAYFNVINDGKV